MRSNQENFEGKSRVIKRFFENSKVQGCCGKDRGGNRLNFCREEFSKTSFNIKSRPENHIQFR